MNMINQVQVRLQVLLGQLDLARKALDSDGIDERLRARVGHVLRKSIDDTRRDVAAALERTGQGQATRGAWISLQTREQQSAGVFRECLAFLQGARARGRDVDAKLCEIAETMLDQLSDACGLAWGRFTILADEEFFSDQAQIIRLRFPFHGIWDLPVAAHEFGHFAAYRLTAGEGIARSAPFEPFVTDYRAQNKLGEEWTYYLNEFFADAFATYSLGPSYAFTSLLLRFGVATANDETDRRHPSYAKRARLILGILDRLNREGDSKGDFDRSIGLLNEYWSNALTSAGVSTELPDGEGDRLRHLTDELYRMLGRAAPYVRYNRWKKSGLLQPSMRPGATAPATGYEVRDLLNAAWRARFEPGSSPDEISDRVVSMAANAAGDGKIK